MEGSSTTTPDAFAVIRVREDGGLGVSGGSYGCILKFKPTGLANSLDVRDERGIHVTPRFMI